MDPPNLFGDTINLSISFGALQDFRVFLDGKDTFPASRKGELDCATTSTGESIDQNRLLGWGDFSYMFGDLP
jgi:hypothetical protein